MFDTQPSLSARVRNTYAVACLRPLPAWRPLAAWLNHTTLLPSRLRAWALSVIPRELAWRDGFSNLTVTTGLNKLLDATLKTGLASPAWYVLLKGNGTVVAGDTMASHSGWSELTPYSDANRPAFTPGPVRH